MASDVIHGVSRTLIETFVRKKLIELKDNPERGTRNLIGLKGAFSLRRSGCCKTSRAAIIP